MSGAELKKILVSYGYNISEIAILLGFASAQRLHSALAATDVKTGLVEEIAKVTKRCVLDFFPEELRQKGAVAYDSSIAVAGHSNHIHNAACDLSKNLVQIIDKKDEQIDRLISVIEQLNKEKK